MYETWTYFYNVSNKTNAARLATQVMFFILSTAGAALQLHTMLVKTGIPSN